jgi:hypothetical protein
MKKINLLAVVVAGVFAVACNGGGSSNNSGGGGGGGDNTPQPTTYTAVIPSGGTLTSVNNLYLASSTTNAPLTFGATNLTTDTTVNFTVQTNSTSSSKLQTNGTVPTLSPSSCTFTAISPQPCTITMNASAAPMGSYSVVPSAGASNMTALSVTTQVASYVTLPDGNYTYAYWGVQPGSCKLDAAVTTIQFTVQNSQICRTDTGECRLNKAFEIPSYQINIRNYDYTYWNGSWVNGVLSYYEHPMGPECPNLITPNTWTKN